MSGGEGGQFTEAFMEGGVGTVAQERRDLGARVTHEVIHMAEFVVRGGEP